MRAFLTLILAGLLGCVTRGTPDPCPGTIQGTFRLRGAVVEGAACADAGGANAAVDLTVSVSFVSDTEAALCIERPEAAPLTGTRSGDTVDVSAAVVAGSAHGCACALSVLERITGAIQRTGATATGFAGELTTSYFPSDGTSACAPTDTTATCGVPCGVRWTLAAD